MASSVNVMATMKKPMGVESTRSPIMEEHFKCKDLAEKWCMSESTILKLFVDEPGVIKIGERSSRKRTKVSIRIPLSVAERVYRKLRSA
jgi:hypothetical protein